MAAVGSAAGVARGAATRIGLTPAEYADRLADGLRYCYRCTDWHPRAEFGKDNSRSDGLARACRESLNAAHRGSYVPKPRPPAGRRFVTARADDQRQARRRVNYLVDAGLLPDPNDVPCADCGHAYEAGERRHEYDHHRGYAPEHHEDVESVCTTCHHRREALRRAA